MPKPFDATTKHMISLRPADWLALAGLPVEANAVVEPADSDLSTVSPAADKIFVVRGKKPYAAHFEFQAGFDPAFDERTLWYNVAGRRQLRMPVRSVAFLLRREAEGPKGSVLDIDGANQLAFRYRLIRVWKLPVKTVLEGGLGALPLAPISAVGKAEVPGVLAEIDRRFEREAPQSQAEELRTATLILMGLKYSALETQAFVKGVRSMKESSTYQAILEEGFEKGEVQGRIREAVALLRLLGTKQFGPPTPSVIRRLESVRDLPALELLATRIFDVKSWNELLGSKKRG